MWLSEPSFLRHTTKTELASETRVPQKKPLEFFRGTEFLIAVRRTEPTTDRREGSGAREVMTEEKFSLHKARRSIK